MLADQECTLEAASRRRATAPLMALAGHALSERFHCWRGASGRRYVATVFAGAAPPDAFSGALVLAVQRLPCGARALVEMADSGDGFAAFAARSRSRGANEWHVHLLAATPAERAMAMRDLRG